jgi:hypothetical protein
MFRLLACPTPEVFSLRTNLNLSLSLGKMEYKISDLSPHLFWDIDSSGLEWQKIVNYIVEKVLIYGVLSDWKIINQIYGAGQNKRSE